MSDNDNYDFEDKEGQKPEQATRARNRTVMLTPDITGQVRARMNQGIAQTVTPTPYVNREADVAATISPTNVNQGQGFYSQVVQPQATEPERIPPPPRPNLHEVRRESAPVEPAKPAADTASVRPATPVMAEKSVTTGGLVDLGHWTNEGALIGFLVTYDRNPHGEVCSLRAGRLIVTSTIQPSGNYILIDDSTVSSLHAIMRVTATGEIQILDQLSESGTFIRRFGSEEEVELSGEKSFLEHGDVVRFGERKFYVTIIARGEG